MDEKVLWTASTNSSNLMTQQARILEIGGQKILEVLCLPVGLKKRLASALKLLFEHRAFVFAQVMLDSDFEKICKEKT